MKQILIPEPALFFARNSSAIDPKVGLLNFGPYGSEIDDKEPRTLRAGVIGTKKSVLELGNWLERLKTRISGGLNADSSAKEVDFPGISLESPLRFEITAIIGKLTNKPTGGGLFDLIGMFYLRARIFNDAALAVLVVVAGIHLLLLWLIASRAG